MNLTEFFNSLQPVDKLYNKYAAYSLAFNNPYKIATPVDAFKYDGFDAYLKQFIIDQGKCIAMPNIFNNEVISIMFRAITSKQFRYYTECSYIPYGAGFNEKKYFSAPWIIVESVLDSDFLRNFYPFVIATNGTTVSNNIMSFIKGTCSTVYCAFDNDTAGNEAFHRLCMKHSGSDKLFHIKRLKPPMKLDGSYLKDFGEVLDYLYTNNISDYNYYVSDIKSILSSL